jgi:hypothetical protein
MDCAETEYSRSAPVERENYGPEECAVSLYMRFLSEKGEVESRYL